ncbi:hypothetical protein HYC85_016965 [Camellia sinensis]|uniref:DNA-directed RNA polymerase n=1 Tax=Camellia sinensis TaxID=4442 RepID=A0A7J7H2D0_CAMSI|nr:hypothetical protein HYC85_016965 [Camellia sinensis]
MYVLSNVASGNEFHKEAVTNQLFPQIGDNIQSIMIKLLQSNDSRLRTACVWTVVNLTFPSRPGAHSRVAKLQNACITSQLKDMLNDPCLDVKVRQMSVVQIEHSEMMERGKPKPGGLSDPRLGTIDQKIKCETCMANMAECPGHFGHLELAKPMFLIFLSF